jgi:polygalacturonase
MTIVSGRDSIALKSGADNDGRRVDEPSMNVVINDVTFALATNSNGAMIAVGPEMAGNVYNTYAYNLSGTGNNERLLGMRSNPSQGGTANNLNIDTVALSVLNDDVANMTFNDDSDASWAGPGGFNPTFSNITISHANISGFPQVLDMSGADTDTSMSISLVNDTFTNLTNNPENITNATATYTSSTLNGVPMQ